MKPSVYVETTIPSYLAARQSPQIVMAARQQITHEWWNDHRTNYNLFISQVVIDESADGDPEAAAKRMNLLRGIDILEPPTDADEIVSALMQRVPLPSNAANDALHIAISVGNGIDYLLTWNCRHIANATLQARMEMVCDLFGFEMPTICTPEQLIEI
ncbi:type II toxin-antitoxin system VapC family toxin [Bythopirellula goksoeyrii]|uniref:PIN domain-containing protein n=1 Tax=Bythopirellula goksoeyrii TaxID=1400387 RepID=A0A5B9QK18_9BACT|nr:type II toxin-antitoxin system VapC family toxin [Bythopirellula goksoeyrii]QEG37930.1 hypothetical protein Pr1d_52780 [Bythopirellula goksoeyrii]